jgi:hypothetical protein
MSSHIDRLRKELTTVLEGATPAALAQAPPGKWNSAQILEHLYLSYTGTTRGLTRCLEKGRPLGTQSRTHLRAFLMLKTGYFPTGVKAPAVAVPRGVPIEEVQQTIFSEIDTMAAKLDECERRFGARTKIMDHPILGPLAVNEWRKIHWLHARHHAKQIRERMRLS